MISIAIILRDLSSAMQEDRNLFMDRHISDSRVFSRQVRTFSFKYLRCFFDPSLSDISNFLVPFSLSGDATGESDDADDGEAEVAGDEGIDIIRVSLDII